MVKRSDKTNTGEGGKGKKGRTVSDDVGGKSLSDTSTSAGVKSTATRTSVNIFEASKSDKTEYFVDKVKDKMFTKVIVQQDLPLQVCESDTMHDFFLEVSQGRYKGVSRGTVRAIVTEMTEEGKDQTKIFVETKFLRTTYSGRSERLGWTSQES